MIFTTYLHTDTVSQPALCCYRSNNAPSLYVATKSLYAWIEYASEYVSHAGLFKLRQLQTLP